MVMVIGWRWRWESCVDADGGDGDDGGDGGDGGDGDGGDGDGDGGDGDGDGGDGGDHGASYGHLVMVIASVSIGYSDSVSDGGSDGDDNGVEDVSGDLPVCAPPELALPIVSQTFNANTCYKTITRK